MSVTIDRCRNADVDDVVRFIDRYWARGHALVASRRLLDWQHRAPDGGYSFIVARRDGDIVGILGYISTKRFDPALARDNVVWLTTWKVREDANVAGLGLVLLQHLAAEEPHVAIGAIGLNPATRPIYRALRYTIGELQHYVRPNDEANRFELASFPSANWVDAGHVVSTPLTGKSFIRLRDFERLDDTQSIRAAGVVPRKTARYFYQRYVAHPLYTYHVMGLFDGDSLVGLLAARAAEHAGRRAVRIVDVFAPPDAIARIGGVVQSLVQQDDAEYADVYNSGVDASVFQAAGFRRVDPEGVDIVPDHFEPFERRNVRLWFSINSACTPVLFKGDSDQDRPNAVAIERR
jgi:hypothetical protein